VRSQLEDCAALLVQDDEPIEERPEAEQVLHQRFTDLIELLKVLEGVSEALLPLVRNQNVDQIKHLLDVALRLGDPDAGEASPDSSQ
jgi:hypothetical protein